MLYDLALNALRLLPPEASHNLTLKALSWGFGARLNQQECPVDLFGKILKTPVGLSAGMDKEAIALPAWEKMGFSFVEIGTVTAEPCAGNKGVRMWRMADNNSLFNFMGLNNSGLVEIKKNIIKSKKNIKSMAIGVSIASITGDCNELKVLTTELRDIIDYFSLNISCPNISQHKNFLDEANKQLSTIIKHAKGKPVLLKLPPIIDENNLVYIVKELLKIGVSGFIASNTQPFLNHDNFLGECIPDWPEKEGKKVGGYSGIKLLPITTKMVKIIRAESGEDTIIIGSGGIQSGMDAKQVIDSGANAVQIFTGLIYKGPKLITEITNTVNTALIKK